MAIRVPLNSNVTPMARSVREKLLDAFEHPAFRASSVEARARIRGLAAETYADGFADGAATNHLFVEQERHFAQADRDEPVTADSKPEDPTQTHVWQTLRVIDVGRFLDADDVDARGYEATVSLRCSCGARVQLPFKSTGVTLPLCPEADQ